MKTFDFLTAGVAFFFGVFSMNTSYFFAQNS